VRLPGAGYGTPLVRPETDHDHHDGNRSELRR
jgi:hypothetical protein